MNVLCKLGRHRWRELRRITWKSDGASTGSATDQCARCPKQRRRFLPA